MISSPSSSPFFPNAAAAAVSFSAKKRPNSVLRSPLESKWRSGTQQRIYGRRLLEALRVTRSGGSSASSKAGPRAIKEAADSALALTARGQTRWSRALLFSRCRRRKVLLKAGGKIRRRRPPRPSRNFFADTATASDEPLAVMKNQRVKDRLRVLSRLVPGCRKLSAPNLLEEAADYVAALELQVKTMRALADALSSADLSSAMEFAFAAD